MYYTLVISMICLEESFGIVHRQNQLRVVDSDADGLSLGNRQLVIDN